MPVLFHNRAATCRVHGDVLCAGALEGGDVSSRELARGVQVTSVRALDKDGDFPDPPMSTAGTAAAASGVAVAARGYGLCGRVPALHVVYATAGAP